MFLEQKKLKNKQKLQLIWTYEDGEILTIQKSLTIKWLRISNKRFFIWIYRLILHRILGLNNKFGIWNNFFFSILWWSS
jgi:hypothetical protein